MGGRRRVDVHIQRVHAQRRRDGGHERCTGQLVTGDHGRASQPTTTVAVRLESADGHLTEIVRALDAEGVRIAHLQIHEPTLDDVFLAKTGRHLEGAGEQEPEAEPAQA